MDHSLPEPFAALADLAGGEPTIEQARALGQALNAVPDLQHWLREQRRRTIRALMDNGHSKEELAPHLKVTPQRVADIASGHSRSKAPRRAISGE
ncbi:sigma-70 family RNA polymerase sigma factor [Streptomyces kronopolitis]|uniref:sigma-70 family RNA polymerase sigma factor n=1 Tax=Streptomyces kronopolitis TaxID=1612435 RepID=UPI00342509A0